MLNKPSLVKVEPADDVKGVADNGALSDPVSDIELDYDSTNDIKGNVRSVDTVSTVSNDILTMT